jgi:hypothetical protein
MLKIAKSKSQYAKAAEEAYNLVVNKKKGFSDAWEISVQKNIEKETSRKKGCPKQTFIGLCDHGHLEKITGKQEVVSINYRYALFAIQEWKKNPKVSNTIMWNKIVERFGEAKNHNEQLSVVRGLWNVIQ